MLIKLFKKIFAFDKSLFNIVMGNLFPVLTNPSIYKVPLLRDFCFCMTDHFIIYKPFQVLSQFSSTGQKQTLADFFKVPRDVYPVGRLDYDSEGLLLLTNDTRLNHRLLNPTFSHEREYWVQVDGAITADAVAQLSKGVTITVDGKPYHTKPCSASLFPDAPAVPVRNPPIRFRKEIPAPWIRLVLTEGKNRQVRKMTAAVGFPTLRLIRYRLEGLALENMQPGDMMQLSSAIIHQKLFHERNT
jgi:23S rRNA pseudouridine2457 synthase